MEEGRASKRRKLDETTLRKRTTPITSSKKINASLRDDSLPPPTASSANNLETARAAWAEAKEKVWRPEHKKRIKEPKPDVYDDIDGAHPSPPKRLPSSTKRKSQLDPLRNQKADGLSSPVKKPAVKGFFKQFHTPSEKTTLPKGWAYPSDDEEKQDDGSSADVNGEAAQLATRPPTKLSTHGNGTNGIDAASLISTARRKTSEDEIKELEEAARKEAKEDNGEETPKSQPSTRRSASRQDHVAKVYQELAKEADERAQRKKPADRRKAARTDHTDAEPEQTAGVEDLMDVEEPTTDPVRTQADEAVFAALPIQAGATISKSKSQPSAKAKALLPTASFDDAQLSVLRHVVLTKLTGKLSNRLIGLSDEYSKVMQLVSHTITAGESNSMLLIGARGSGKTALVEDILREQAYKHPRDFLVVRLNGFIHTDDKTALREIWRQLGREMELDEGESNMRNYADTLTSLLALLSHPTEQGRDQPDQVTKSVVFVLDEFELFASHPRQTLLYNLFDIAQSRKAPIAVLGLTTRIDVAELLEKRVKSRFSHRYVHLGLAKNFPAFREMCKSVLCINMEEILLDMVSLSEAKDAMGSKLMKAARDGSNTVAEAVDGWKAVVESLLANEAFTTHLRRLYYTTKSVPDFKSSMVVPLATLPVDSENDSAAIVEHITNTLHTGALHPPDSKLDLLSSLSTLQLALLICAARLTNIYNTELISFALAYEEYKVLASKAKLQASASGSLAQGASARVSNKDVAKNAWDELVECGLVIEDGRAGAGRVDVGLEEIGMSGVELGQWGRWCREI